MLPAIHLGPLMLQMPGLMLLLGLWLGLEAASRFAPRVHISGETLANVVLIGLGVGAIAARLGYAARFPDVYLSAPLSLFSLNPQTLDWSIGILAGLAAAWLYTQRKQMPLRATLDALSPGLAVFAVFAGLAHIASGDAYGLPTSLPWGIELWGAARHPTQFYETIFALAIAARIARETRHANGDGTLFLQTIGLLAAARLFVEAFRGDSAALADGIRAAQIVALLVVLAVVWLYPQWQERTPRRPHKR